MRESCFVRTTHAYQKTASNRVVFTPRKDFSHSFIVTYIMHFREILQRHFRNSEIREIPENVGKFSPGKFREIFPRIFLHFQGMQHMLQP